jgi:DNA-binding transcriptional MerR regulator
MSSHTLTSKGAHVSPQTGPQQTNAPDTQKLANRRPMKAKDAPQKAAGAFRTISEVAEELKVEQHVLRFWETRFSQIKPLKRGGGRRYYRPEDVELLKNIHHLLYSEGYTIKGVQKLLSATRGNLSARVEAAAPVGTDTVELAPETEAASPVTQAVQKNRDELATMLAELKSMRRLID